MTIESIILLTLLVGALVLFYTEALRTDLVALMLLMALIVPWKQGHDGRMQGILSVQEAFSGFGSTAVAMVAAMFVLSAALVRTGAAQLLGGRVLASSGTSELRFQLTVLGCVTVFSAFVNDTSTVLVWMPLVLIVCRDRGYSPSRVLLLVAFGSLLGGQWTLIGTRSNIIVSDFLRKKTGEGFSFFELTPVAVAVFLGVVVWFITVGRRGLPRAGEEESLAERYEVAEYLTEVMASPNAEIVGKTLGELDLFERNDITLVQVIRNGEHLPPSSWLKLYPGDVMVIQGRISKITDVLARPGLDFREELKIGDKTLKSVDLRMVEALVAPDADVIGRTLEELDFQRIYGLSVLAIARHGQRVATERPKSMRLRFGDSLLLVGHESEVDRLKRNPSFLMLESRPMPALGKRKAWLALTLLLGATLTSATGLLSPAIAIPFAGLLAVLTRCIGLRQAYSAINLPAIVTVGAMIPFGLALESTGTAEWMAQSVVHVMGEMGLHVVFAVTLLITVLFTQLIENAAVASVISPLAFELARASGADPRPFLVGVAICISAAFMTPVAHESTILVMAPGRYVFRDYLRLGAPFALITWLVTALLLPFLMPLR